MEPPFRRFRLHRPDLVAVADCLDRACRDAFEDASVELIDSCPDLSEPPFCLASRGICGGGGENSGPVLSIAGGVPYLLPTPQVEQRRYDLRNLLKATGHPDGLIIGAGAASSTRFGRNAELVANLGPLGNGCRVASLRADGEDDGTENLANCRLSRPDFAEAGLMVDSLCSSGQTDGPVFRLRASRWRPETATPDWSAAKTRGRLAELLQRALAKEFSGCKLPVGLGGVFRLSGAAARMHVMPDFSPTPLTCSAEVNSWLRFFNMPPPIVCCGVLISHDPHSWGLRLEHYHGWNPSSEQCGGHYHYDASPDTAEYLGYFSLATSLLRMDPPGGVDSLTGE
ncbi:hypothetical protein BOX15_Mlig022135g1 [Macrostomum lignano]|uniref:Uncharacterized protein n=2 Tax=Macrostomum lignano TaxID=282301 RepID=A0A267GH81_9PLAT|nr:hypothetical protein BOX15_Mlig022135g1 [Macrostomum lignano]